MAKEQKECAEAMTHVTVGKTNSERFPGMRNIWQKKSFLVRTVPRGRILLSRPAPQLISEVGGVRRALGQVNTKWGGSANAVISNQQVSLHNNFINYLYSVCVRDSSKETFPWVRA